MATSTTTNITIGTLLDLVGASSASQSPESAAAGFDALLHAPAASPPAARETKSEEPAPRTRQEARGDASDPSSSSPAAPPATAKHETSSDDQPHPEQVAASEESEAVPSADADRDEPADPQASLQEADVILVESLAGLTSAVQLVPDARTTVEVDAVAVDESKPAVEENTVKAGASQAKPWQVTDGAVTIPGDPKSPDAPKDKLETAAQETGNQRQTDKKQTIVQPQSNAEIKNSQPAAKTDSPAVEAGHLAAESPAESRNPRTDAGGEKSQPKQDPTSDTAAADRPLDVSAVSENTPSNTQGDASPIVAPVAPAVQSVEANAPNGQTTAPPTSASSAPTTQRSRLPAEVFSKPASGLSRRTAGEADATRLLARVARAFAVARDRDGEIRLRLSPPELGSLRLELRVQDGAMVARLQTETDAARTTILENLPALRERLLEQGVRIERFDVDLMQRQPGGMPDQPGGRQQDFPATPPRLAPQPRAAAEKSSATNVAQRGTVSADGLNVIV